MGKDPPHDLSVLSTSPGVPAAPTTPSHARVPAPPAPVPRREISPLALGFRLALASLSMFFGATLVAYVLVRARSVVWRPPELPTLLPGLLAATLLLVIVSLAAEAGRLALLRNHPQSARRRFATATVAAVAFLGAQGINWSVLGAAAARTGTPTLYPFTLYMVTGVHAAHVIAGVVVLVVVLVRLHSGQYSSSRSEPVQLATQYWHYLAIVWAVLFATLCWGSA